MKNRFLKIVANPGWWRRALPRRLKDWAYSRIPAADYYQLLGRANNQFVGSGQEFSNEAGSRVKLGIIWEYSQEHRHYIAGCIDHQVSYEVIDIMEDRWIERVRGSGCDGFLVWPPIFLEIWKGAFDERLSVLHHDLGFPLFPSVKETWLYESKRRQRDWFRTHDIATPVTWVFLNRDEAQDFIAGASFPIVFKTNRGAGSKGVRIVRSKAEAELLVRQAFSKGIVPSRGDRRDRQWGSVLFLEYLPAVREWRMVRIGDSFFCREKGRVGDFHSGSHLLRWAHPKEEVLEFTRAVTDAGGFQSMSVDVFETGDSQLLVNELHTVCGVNPVPNENEAGRFLFSGESAGWKFEHGDFHNNAYANLRIECFLNSLLKSDVGSREK